MGQQLLHPPSPFHVTLAWALGATSKASPCSLGRLQSCLRPAGAEPELQLLLGLLSWLDLQLIHKLLADSEECAQTGAFSDKRYRVPYFQNLESKGTGLPLELIWRPRTGQGLAVRSMGLQQKFAICRMTVSKSPELCPREILGGGNSRMKGCHIESGESRWHDFFMLV